MMSLETIKNWGSKGSLEPGFLEHWLYESIIAAKPFSQLSNQSSEEMVDASAKCSFLFKRVKVPWFK